MRILQWAVLGLFCIDLHIICNIHLHSERMANSNNRLHHPSASLFNWKIGQEPNNVLRMAKMSMFDEEELKLSTMFFFFHPCQSNLWLSCQSKSIVVHWSSKLFLPIPNTSHADDENLLLLRGTSVCKWKMCGCYVDDHLTISWLVWKYSKQCPKIWG